MNQLNRIVSKILDFYSVKYKKVFPAQKGYRNSSFPVQTETESMINVIIYKNEKGISERIKRSNIVSDYLYEKGLPTRNTYLKKILKIKSRLGERYAAIYYYLPGTTIPWEAYTKDHIKLLGEMMGKMHNELHKFSILNVKFPNEVELSSLINKRMEAYFLMESVKNAMEKKLGLVINNKAFQYFERLLELLEKEEKQVLHMDFVRSNVLYQKIELNDQSQKLTISGVLDFEKTAVGPKIFDIARTLAFLVVDCRYKDEEKVRKYFLYSGYKKRGKTTLPSLKYLKHLLNFYWMYDFYKFLKHNPYEYLEQNEHFMRTRKKLIESKLIKSI